MKDKYQNKVFIRLLRVGFFFTITCLALPLNFVADTALPSLATVNSSWTSVTNLWEGAEPLELPTKLIVEFSHQESRAISGIVCEYPNKAGLFQSIRERLQKKLKIEPRMEKAGSFILWRDEVGKRTITITLDEAKEKIQVIIVSIAR